MESEGIWSDIYGLNQEEYDRKFRYKPQSSLLHRLRKRAHRLLVPCSSFANFWKLLTGFVPILHWLPRYGWKDYFLWDVIGGLTTGVMHVPQGIAYAVLSGVDPVYGLYSSFFPALFYMFFGTSKHTSLGSFAVIALMSGLANDEIMLRRSRTDSTIVAGNDTVSSLTTIEVATTLAFTTGIVEIVAGIFHLEFMTAYFSDQLVSGFTTGSAVHVFIAQIDDVFGITVPKSGGFGYIFKRAYDILIRIPQSNLYTLGLSVFGVAFLYVGKEYVSPLMNKHLPAKVPMPYELLLIIISTFISYCLNLNTYHDVPIVGKIPAGLPEPRLPRFDVIGDCILNAIGIAAVVVAVHISMAKLLAKRMKYTVDSGQELYALGLATSLGSFFSIYPVATALGRTMVNVESGSKTQLSALPSCLLLLAVILWVGPLLKTLPMCTLAVIILMALRSMFRKFAELPKIWPVSKIDFLIWVVSFVATVAVDVMTGLVISIIFALLTLIFRSQWPRWQTLVQLSVSRPYFDNPKRYGSAVNNPNICLYRFDSPLLFNNVERFKSSVHDATTIWENETDKHSGLMSADNAEKFDERFLIIDCSSVSFIDYMGLNALKEIAGELQNLGITVFFSACNTSVRDFLEAAEFFKIVPKKCFFPTVDDAIACINHLRPSAGKEVLVQESNDENCIRIKVDSDGMTGSCPQLSRKF